MGTRNSRDKFTKKNKVQAKEQMSREKYFGLYTGEKCSFTVQEANLTPMYVQPVTQKAERKSKEKT